METGFTKLWIGVRIWHGFLDEDRTVVTTDAVSHHRLFRSRIVHDMQSSNGCRRCNSAIKAWHERRRERRKRYGTVVDETPWAGPY